MKAAQSLVNAASQGSSQCSLGWLVVFLTTAIGINLHTLNIHIGLEYPVFACNVIECNRNDANSVGTSTIIFRSVPLKFGSS